MTVECNIEDLDFGWSKFIISNNQIRCEFEYSYLANPIEDLIYALYELNQCNSRKEFRIVFPEEPGQNVLHVINRSETDITIKITSSSIWEKVANAYNFENNEKLVYLDENETKKNFTKIILRAIGIYSNVSSEINIDKVKNTLIELNKISNNPN